MQNIYLLKNRDNDLWTGTTLAKLIIFCVWPFGAFLYSFRHPSKFSSFLIFFLFALLFSWSMYYDDYTSYIDFIGVSERFYQIGTLSSQEVWSAITNVFSERTEYNDVYNLILVWVIAQFTNNFHVQYLIAAIPFMLFMLSSIRYMFDSFSSKLSFIAFVLIFLFILPRDPFHIQNFRFSTATWMSVYGILAYFISERKSGLIWVLLSPFVHSSFWFLVAVVLMYCLFIRHFKSAIKIFFYVSIPVSFISSEALMGIEFTFLPDALREWSAQYLSKEAFNQYGMVNVWSGSGFFFVRIAFYVLRSILYLLIPIIVLKNIDFKQKNVKEINFWGFYLFCFAIINMIQSIPVLGFRFFGIIRIFSVLVWVKYLAPKYKTLIYLLLVSCVYEILFEIIPLYTMVLDWDFLFGNLFSVIAKHWGVTSFPHLH